MSCEKNLILITEDNLLPFSSLRGEDHQQGSKHVGKSFGSARFLIIVLVHNTKKRNRKEREKEMSQGKRALLNLVNKLITKQ